MNALSEVNTPSPTTVQNALAIEFGDNEEEKEFENGEDVLQAVEAELGVIVPE